MRKTMNKIMAKKTKKRIKLTPDQKKQWLEERKRKLAERRFKFDINTVFKNAGFSQIPTRDIHFTFKEKTTEFDNLFIFENIIVIVEDTCTTSSDEIRDHLSKKSFQYKLFQKHKNEFVNFIENTFERFKEIKNPKYDPTDYKLIFVYCSRYRLEEKHKRDFSEILFLDYRYLCYFLSLAKTIQKSSRFELFKFLKLNIQDIGTDIAQGFKKIPGSVLPESPSGFAHGHKVITFYIDPATLIQLSFVMRKDGWLDSDSLYQRMLIKNKILSMREYLANEKRVFINNIIVTLPPTTRLLHEGNTIDIESISKTQPVDVQIPYEYNTIGIIDGQHRVFAYHEGLDQYEVEISKKRDKQHLLVTGIVYPSGLSKHDQTKFEAKLFLEINDKQKKTKPDLKQVIETIVNPFGVIAISKSIITKLNNNGALTDVLEDHYFDKGKIKTASIVSYGLRHIVKLGGSDSLFKIWTHPEKDKLQLKKNKDLLDAYIDFCASEINKIFTGFKIPQSKNGMWILNSKKSRVLTTTSLNGVIFCLRMILQEKSTTFTMDEYISKMAQLNIDFTPGKFKYKSSHWKELGDDIYKQCFL
jgi:DGQHR domain-containing protein